MLRRSFIVAALLGCLLAPVGASPRAAKSFIDEMFRGVGARSVPCPIEVVARTQPHAMNVVCARFDGTFEVFEARWSLHLRRLPAPSTTPQTGWEQRQGKHERIYTVGQVAVGVRFQRGEIVAVYK